MVDPDLGEKTLVEVIDVLYRAAAHIDAQFMPNVFRCTCNGLAPDCARILREDGRVWERKDAIDKVVAYLRAEAAKYEEAQAEREHEQRRANIDAWHKETAEVGQR